MQIRTFEEIRQNYHTIAELCKETAEPVFLTKDGHTVDEVAAMMRDAIREASDDGRRQ